MRYMTAHTAHAAALALSEEPGSAHVLAGGTDLLVQLKAGNINEAVQITDAPPLLNESPAVSTVVDQRFVENLPLNGRSFQSLIASQQPC